MRRLVSQAEGDRIRKILTDAQLPIPEHGSLIIDGDLLRYTLKNNSSIGNDTIKALLAAGVNAKTDPIETPANEAYKTKENSATDRVGGGCAVWIQLADPKAGIFRD